VNSPVQFKTLHELYKEAMENIGPRVLDEAGETAVAREIIEKIPQKIKAADRAGNTSAIVCTVCDDWLNYEDDPVYFDYPGVLASMFARHVKPEWLMPSARMVWDHCLTAGLRPRLGWLWVYRGFGEVYCYSRMRIRWDKGTADSLLSDLAPTDR
jgi:hypothetical protein